MGRSRVLSFMSQFSSNNKNQPSNPSPTQTAVEPSQSDSRRQDAIQTSASPSASTQFANNATQETPIRQRERGTSTSSRPMSMIQTYQPSLMDVTQDTIPELQPIFTFLNSHANKLYQEGYFLKLDDQNTHGRTNADRTWTECFAQLVGTVLSLWDAAELDAAGQDGEVLPKFINLTDASIKMIESLPTRSDSEPPLQNVLSISTAGKNRYLLHFNSHHSLIQWTAGIRLAMFEHATLQEAYTGALIAGKGKTLNNIRDILERARLPTADWARVRFGAGTPWRRCWCVITPPDEKEVQKLQKQMSKKKSVYDKTQPPVLKGTIKFYDTKKTKKVRPIATISDAYSAYAIYPQSKPLIDASTLIKLEGAITIESNPPSTTEGFIFVMPETHAAVSGFEILLRWLFPAFDTFALYGRPTRLIADVKDTRSLMFAMPKHKRYGYLEILDVTSLILEQGSSGWRESEWRKRMKELTAKRMTAIESGSRRDSQYGSRRSARNSLGPQRSRVQFDDGASIRSSPSITWNHPPQDDGSSGIPRTDSAPPGTTAFAPALGAKKLSHHRSVSETHGLDRFQQHNPAQYDHKFDQDLPPPPPPHLTGIPPSLEQRYQSDLAPTPERVSSEDERAVSSTPVQELQDLQAPSVVEPVAAPPAFQHGPGTLPVAKPYQSPELRRANSRMSSATLAQLAGASGVVAAHQTAEEQRRQDAVRSSEDGGQRGVMSDATTQEFHSNRSGPYKGLANAPPEAQRYPSDDPTLSRHVNDPTTHSQLTFNSTYNSNSNTTFDSSMRHKIGPEHEDNSISNTHPPVPIHAHVSQASTDLNSLPASSRNRQSISRKPIPSRGTSADGPINTQNPARQSYPVMDQAAYDRLRQDPQQHNPVSVVNRNNSGFSSVYSDDNASTASPDYASTRRSFETPRSTDKPRAGVMRTVGNNEDQPSNQNLVPDINFGPTINYAALASKPLPAQPQGRQSPGLSLNQPTLARPPRSQSPVRRPESSGLSRSPKRNSRTPDNFHNRMDSAGTRTMAWQPGMAATGRVSPSAQQTISAEQFVQQRANTKPMYAHQRQSSSGNLIRGQTPPLVRNRSSELLQQMHIRNNSVDVLQRPSSRGTNLALNYHSRNNSTDVLQRPASRGPTTALGPSGSGDIASKLSAREQEHVARVTGQPLVNIAQNRNSTQQGPGLVGAIQQREIEKQQAKQGINSQVVQNAINQRQQQQAHAQSQYGGGMMQSPQYGQGQQQQQQYKNPAHQAYWTASPTTGVVHNYNQRSPGQFVAQQGQQYFPNQGPQLSPQYPPNQPGQQQQQQQYFPPQQGQQSQQGQQKRYSNGFHGHGNN